MKNWKSNLCLFGLAILSAAIPSQLLGQDSRKKSIAPLKPVPTQTVAFLSPANSSVSFVGSHRGSDPEPQIGGFGKFDGHIVVDMKSKKLKAIKVMIQTDSLWTEIGELTRHLKNKDFFETSKFPKAIFRSKSIELDSEGKHQITGSLTLHGKTADIQFPAEVTIGDGGVKFHSKFQLDRTKFGIGKPLGGIQNLVSVEISVGRPTNIPPEKEDDDDDDDRP